MFARKVPNENQGQQIELFLLFKGANSHLKEHPKGAISNANHCSCLPACSCSLSTIAKTIHKQVNNTPKEAQQNAVFDDVANSMSLCFAKHPGKSDDDKAFESFAKASWQTRWGLCLHQSFWCSHYAVYDGDMFVGTAYALLFWYLTFSHHLSNRLVEIAVITHVSTTFCELVAQGTICWQAMCPHCIFAECNIVLNLVGSRNPTWSCKVRSGDWISLIRVGNRLWPLYMSVRLSTDHELGSRVSLWFVRVCHKQQGT